MWPARRPGRSMAIVDSTANEPEHDDDGAGGNEAPKESSLRDQLMQELMRAKKQKKEVAHILRQLDSLDGEVLAILAHMIDGDAGGNSDLRAWYPFRIDFVRRQNHRPKRRTFDFKKSGAAVDAARLIADGCKAEEAFARVAAKLKKSSSYVRDAYYEKRRRRNSPVVGSN